MAKQSPFVTFHNPLEHPEVVFDEATKKSSLSGKMKPADPIKFSIQTHEDGAHTDFALAPGEEADIPSQYAYAIKSLAPQLKEGPLSKGLSPKK